MTPALAQRSAGTPATARSALPLTGCMCGRPGALCMACGRRRRHYRELTERRAAWRRWGR